jgi:hypothetical protein
MRCGGAPGWLLRASPDSDDARSRAAEEGLDELGCEEEVAEVVRLQLLLEAVARKDPASPSQDAGVVDEGIEGCVLCLEIGAELADGCEVAEVKAGEEDLVSALTRTIELSFVRFKPHHFN